MAEYFAEDPQTNVVLLAPVGPILRTLVSPKLLTHIPAASIEAKDEFHIIMEYKREEKVGHHRDKFFANVLRSGTPSLRRVETDLSSRTTGSLILALHSYRKHIIHLLEQTLRCSCWNTFLPCSLGSRPRWS